VVLAAAAAVAMLAVAVGMVVSSRDDGDSDSATPSGEQVPGGEKEPKPAGPGSEGDGSGEPDPDRAIAGRFDLSGVTVKIGWLDLTDQYILANVTALALEEAGATYEAAPPVGSIGARALRGQLLDGQIDIYWDYMGTPAGFGLSDLPLNTGPGELRDVLVDLDEPNGLTWLEPASFARAEAVAMRRSEAERLEVSSLSDVATVAGTDPGATSYCYSLEEDFLGLEANYGFDFADEVFVPDPLATYQELAAGTCNFARVPHAIHPDMVGYDLVTLDDPVGAYTNSSPAPRMRLEDLAAHPEIADVLAPIAEALDDDAMARLVARAEDGGEVPADVARDWLVTEGFIAR
jgi:osmoprotectant transport system substrate-binding protein